MTPIATITWWGAAGVEVSFGDRTVVVDPYLHPAEPRADYVCVTRENHEHCHEPTLEALAQGATFKRMLVPKSATVASRLDALVGDDARDLAFVDAERLTVVYPKHTRKAGARYPEPQELEADDLRFEVFESSESEAVNVLGTEFWGKRWRPASGTVWPSGTGPFAGGGQFQNLGYVVTDTRSGLTVYHPGDLQEAFDSQRLLRGRIDYMFLPLAPLEGVELSVIDNVRPRHVIPIHYRVDEPGFPIPLEINAARITTTDLFRGLPHPWADPDVYREEVHAMKRAHWYATPARPLERLEQLRPEIEALGTEVVVLTAGRPHEVTR